jgi:hypothetical protein
MYLICRCYDYYKNVCTSFFCSRQHMYLKLNLLKTPIFSHLLASKYKNVNKAFYYQNAIMRKLSTSPKQMVVNINHYLIILLVIFVVLNICITLCLPCTLKLDKYKSHHITKWYDVHFQYLSERKERAVSWQAERGDSLGQEKPGSFLSLKLFTKRNVSQDTTNTLEQHVYCSTIHNSQPMEIV